MHEITSVLCCNDFLLTLINRSEGEASTSIARISPSPKVDYKDITILIVEDNLVNQRVLQKQLHRAGFVTEVSNHGLEALHKLEGSSFWKHESPTAERTSISCVLMDLEMPISMSIVLSIVLDF